MRKTMRKIVAAAVLSLALCACRSGNSVSRTEGQSEAVNASVSGRFISDSAGDEFSLVTDTRTGVTYLKWERPSGKSSVGGITVLVDKDGKPIMSEETK